ncbi:MAG: AAA family ATPase [Candidatus Syntrophonatronum acetioxidans]|uniref:AAA family ATPase n=1 Tax=Candidatus Syntrophonatronum acetioxidans TaxID=1795816 RepID=A0A424YIN0_9FIRM|nr:MAG: AAA family ATPase [Candidatus Syntrophonatronum acetioxidans]
MIDQQTIEKLKKMRLYGMAECLQNQRAKDGLSFEERLGLLVDYEWTCRQNRRLQRLLKEAKLKLNACMEDIDYQHPRNLDKNLITSLRKGQWLLEHKNVLFTGPTGTGKTYLICALGNMACRLGFSARYYRLSDLMSDLKITRADGTYPKFTNKLAKTHLLIIDDFGLEKLPPVESKDLLELIDDRIYSACTVVAGQLPVEHWHSVIGEPAIADAIVDRLIHGSYKNYLNGDSMRKKYVE